MRPLRVTRPAVKAVDVVLGYGSHTAVERSSFHIPRPGITAIIGPNGSGKSTILNVISGLLAPISGTVEFPDTAGARPDISYVLQTTKVNDALPVTVEEVVAMGRYSKRGRFKRLGKSDRDAVTEAMQRAGVDSIRRRHLHQLSGGQRQRTFIAQGMAQEHTLLLLDEPLSGIDLPTARAIDKVIHDEVEDGCAVVITTHDLSEASVADHVILLSGRVIAEGPPRNVMTTDNLTAAYGQSVLHPEFDVPVIDDPAHTPVDTRHTHRSFTHPESDPDGVHRDS
ncbi:MAG: metal ABC transporter ATP-binding protein [Acidimicrobiia bacterium]